MSCLTFAHMVCYPHPPPDCQIGVGRDLACLSHHRAPRVRHRALGLSPPMCQVPDWTARSGPRSPMHVSSTCAENFVHFVLYGIPKA